MFDKYRDDPQNQPDSIGVEGSMRYLQDLDVSLEEVVLLAVLTELSSPSMGELTREGFVEGWKKHNADTIAKQKAIVKNLRQSLGRQQEFFKSVYKSTFNLARTPGQRSLPLENAIEYWRLLFVEPSVNWGTPKTPWLEWWIEYLETSWKKAISKDMWDQAAVFVLKSLEDETMSWWSEDGAWPGVLDEFVRFVEEKRKAGAGAEDGKMDIA